MGGADHWRPHYFRPLVAKWASSACLKADIDGLSTSQCLVRLLGDKHHPSKAARTGDRVWGDRPRAPPNKDKRITSTYFKVSAGTYSQGKWYYTTSTKARSVVKYLHVPSDLVVAEALMLCSWLGAATANIS